MSYLILSTIDDLAALGLSIAILEQVPKFPNYPSSKAVREPVMGRADKFDGERSQLHVAIKDVDQRQHVFQTLVSSGKLPPNANVVRTRQLFCNHGRCSVVNDGRPANFDNNQVATETEVMIGGLLDPAFSNSETTIK